MQSRIVPTRVGGAVLAGLFALGITGCSFPNKPVTTAAAEVSEPLSSAEILQVLHVINMGEINQAQLALQRSANPQVQQTAQTIIEDHTASDQRIANAAQMLGVRLEGTSLSEGIQFQAEQIRETLAELSGPEFNQTYLEKQVELHNVALDTVRNQLLPNAEQREVTQLLEQAIPKLQHHRDLAQQGL
ncbi:DUF4142 domain-containing protein [Modicisalibacter luteus]|uniref:DUF4142 domain-containing protein n=1 Tax=Modicisalibacter luteus TaxID=453962 RepID=A0ABV7M473_9GAMM|nr:DUF4142 domain-containing protein [Halomonas lutea]GHA86998.1 hypothetical protein GCM10007159_05260 [Halomonas lutea]